MWDCGVGLCWVGEGSRIPLPVEPSLHLPHPSLVVFSQILKTTPLLLNLPTPQSIRKTAYSRRSRIGITRLLLPFSCWYYIPIVEGKAKSAWSGQDGIVLSCVLFKHKAKLINATTHDSILAPTYLSPTSTGFVSPLRHLFANSNSNSNSNSDSSTSLTSHNTGTLA